jgi:hypothetical protein
LYGLLCDVERVVVQSRLERLAEDGWEATKAVLNLEICQRLIVIKTSAQRTCKTTQFPAAIAALKGAIAE